MSRKVELLFTPRMDKYQGPTIYGIGNYIQYPVKNHNGKEYKGEYVCSPSY